MHLVLERERTSVLEVKDRPTITVLELGAGTGRLAHFLQDQLADSRPGGINVRVVATDSGGWALKGASAGIGKVEKLGFVKALEKYQPEVVIVAWMPMGTDW